MSMNPTLLSKVVITILMRLKTRPAMSLEISVSAGRIVLYCLFPRHIPIYMSIYCNTAVRVERDVSC